MKTEDFNYDLPESLIAQTPLKNRDESRLMVLDKNTGEMAICNAGHPYPIIKEKGSDNLRMPCKTSLPMGISKKRCRYNSELEVLNPGETLFLYTDGFPEAENKNGVEYGYDNFKDLIAKAVVNKVEDLKNNLIKTFEEYHGKEELADDITFIILKRESLQDY